MQGTHIGIRTDGHDRHRSILTGLLRGYRFSVCETPEEAARALDVRRQVYQQACGYDVPVPDGYDDRSWLLAAEHVRSGRTVGTLRVTPRSEGPLEAEEYFELFPHLRSPRVVEATRFAILPDHRDSRRFLPVVALGLFKLAVRFVRQIGAHYVVVCSKPERVWTYQWLRFERAGLTAPYGKLGASPHELLTTDLRFGVERHSDHKYWDFFFGSEHREVMLPQCPPRLGLATEMPGEHMRLAGRA